MKQIAKLIASLIVSVSLAMETGSVAAEPPDLQWMYGGHIGGVQVWTWSPDGSQVVTGGDTDYTLKVWDSGSLQLEYTLYGHAGAIQNLDWSTDGQWLVSVDYARWLRVWSTASREAQYAMELPARGRSVRFAPNASQFALGTEDPEVTIRDTATGSVLVRLTQPTAQINDIDYSPDGQRLAAIADDHRVYIWRTADWTLERTIVAHNGFSTSVEFSPDSSILATAGDLIGTDPSVKFWNPDTGSLIRRIFYRDAISPAAALDFSPDGAWIGVAASAATGYSRIYEVNTGIEIGSAVGSGAMRFSPDGDRVLALDFPCGEPFPIAEFSVPDLVLQRRFISHTSRPTDVSATGDGIVASCAEFFDSSIMIWDAQTGQRLYRLLYTCNGDGLEAVAVSSDNTYVAGGGGDWGRNVRVWRLADEALILELPHGETAATAVDFTGDAQFLASGDRGGLVIIWAIPSGNATQSFTRPGDVNDLDYSDDGARLAVAMSTGDVHIVNPMTGADQQLISNSHAGGASAVEFSADGARLLTAGADGAVRFWDSQTGALLQSIVAHAAPVSFADLSPDNRTVISCSTEDATIAIWDTETGALIARYDERTGITGRGPVSVEFTADGSGFVFNRRDGSVGTARATASDTIRLEVNGTCPGVMAAEASHATPNGQVAFVAARGVGSASIPQGYPCAGTVLGLDASVRVLGARSADENGRSMLSGFVQPSYCGRVFVQAIDVSSCQTSNVVVVQ